MSTSASLGVHHGGEASGQDLLLAFRAADCPGLGRLRGEDLDWLAQSGGRDVAEFLGRMSRQLRRDAGQMVLSEQEAAEWEQLSQQRPDRVLRGRALEDALAVTSKKQETKDQGFAAPADLRPLSSLREELASLQDEVAAHPARRLAQLSASLMGPAQAATAAQTARVKRLLDGPASRGLRARQEEVMAAARSFDEALGEAAHAVQTLLGKLRSEEMNLLHKWPLDRFEQEDAKIIEAMKDLISLQFSESDDHGWLGIPEEEGRSRQLREVERLHGALKDSLRDKLSSESLLAGEHASADSLSRNSKRMVHSVHSLDVEDCRQRIHALQTRAEGVQGDLKSLGRDQLVDCSASVADGYIAEIRALEMQREWQRMIYEEKKLGILADLLVQERARQCVLALMAHREQESLKWIRDKVSEFRALCQGWLECGQSELSAVARLEAFVAEKRRTDVVPQSDVLANAVLALLNETGRPLSNTPQVEFLSQLDSLQKSHAGAVESDRARRREFARLKDELRGRLGEMHELAQRSDPGQKHDFGGSSRVLAAASELQRAVRAFEVNVLAAANQWDVERAKATATPEEKAQRRLWIDFWLNPKVLQANVEAMEKKAEVKLVWKG